MAHGLAGGKLNTPRVDASSSIFTSCPNRQRCPPGPSCTGESSLWSLHRPQSRCLRQQQLQPRNRRCAIAECIRCIAADQSATIVGPPTYAKAPGRIVASASLHTNIAISILSLESRTIYEIICSWASVPALSLTQPFIKGHQLIGRCRAVGDIHGDLQKTFTALSISGVFREGKDGEPLWCGGDTTVVQLGDVMDRGDREIGELMSTNQLKACARQTL